MPLTALDSNGGILDSTDCPDTTWTTLHRNSTEGTLTCRECSGRMVAKVSVTGLRFFAHYRRPDNCSSQTETPEHRELKRYIAELIRAAGGQALIEATPADGDTGGWRADTLAITADGRRIAFEIQLSGMTIDEGETRTQKYQQDGIATLWVTTKHAHWLFSIPSVKVQRNENGPWDVTRGTARLDPDRPWRWKPTEPVPLDKIVTGLVTDRVTSCETHDYFSEGSNGRDALTYSPILIVSTQHRTAYEEALKRKSLADAKYAAEKAAYQRNMEALYARQETTLQSAVMDAAEHAQPGERIWLGVPPDPWLGELPVPLTEALGNEKTGMGAAIWIGPTADDKRLWAVICPVAGRINPSLGQSWHRRNVAVYAATPTEAVRLATALNWPTDNIRTLPQ